MCSSDLEARGGAPSSTEVAYECLETGKSSVRKNKVSVRAPSQDGGDKLGGDKLTCYTEGPKA